MTADLPPSDLFWTAVIAVAINGLSQMILLWLLIALAVLDFEHLWLPDKITIPGILVGFATTLIYAAVNSKRVFAFYGALELRRRFLWHIAGERLLAILAAASLILLIRWIYWLIRRREGIGLGDAKLMAMLAAWLGLQGALLSFGVGVVLGALAAVALLLLPSKRDSNESWAAHQAAAGHISVRRRNRQLLVGRANHPRLSALGRLLADREKTASEKHEVSGHDFSRAEKAP